MFSIFRPLIFSLDPEIAHDLAINSLKINVLPKNIFQVDNEELLETNLFNEKLPNPIGLAAGFDKSAEVYNEIFKIGFGFVEVGTVTPKKQYGNEKPRVFRLEKDQALINRLGFNNDGSEIIKKRIEYNTPNGLLGINIGPNKDTDDMLNYFLLCAKIFFPIGDYITINISSPNTEGLRSFHNKENLEKGEKIYKELKKQNIDVLFDDVDENMSNKFKKHDLIGIPYQIIIGSKSEGDNFEFKELNGASEILSLEKIKSKIKT